MHRMGKIHLALLVHQNRCNSSVENKSCRSTTMLGCFIHAESGSKLSELEWNGFGIPAKFTPFRSLKAIRIVKCIM